MLSYLKKGYFFSEIFEFDKKWVVDVKTCFGEELEWLQWSLGAVNSLWSDAAAKVHHILTGLGNVRSSDHFHWKST